VDRSSTRDKFLALENNAMAIARAPNPDCLIQSQATNHKVAAPPHISIFYLIVASD